VGAEDSEEMIPRSIFSAKIHPNTLVLLLLLWDFAGSPDGDADGTFVWPSLQTLQDTLGCSRAAVYRRIADLIAAGYIERATRMVTTSHWTAERRGFVLRTRPREGKREPPDDGTGYLDGEHEDEAPSTVASDAPADVPSVADCNADPASSKPSVSPSETFSSHPARQKSLTYRDSHPYQEDQLTPSITTPARAHALQPTGQIRRQDDDDGARARSVWNAYEIERVEILGGSPHRRATPSELRAIVELKRYVTERFSFTARTSADAWSMVERYGREAIKLAAKAVRDDVPIATRLVAARSDGREWSPERLDAVMARVDIRPRPQLEPRSTAPPVDVPAEPPMSPERVGALASSFLKSMQPEEKTHAAE
jgi:hypothetical protein